MPDGKKLIIGNERFRSTECLFKPLEMNGKDVLSIQEMILESIHDSDEDYRPDLFNNIILSGGNTMLEGFRDRIYREIESRAPRNTNFRVIASPDRKYAVWRGGSTLCSLSTFSDLCITKEDYDEYGA